MSLSAKLATAIGVPIFTALGQLVAKRVANRARKRTRDYWMRIIETHREIQACIDELRTRTDACRVMVLQANNGNAPRVGCQLKSTAIFESIANGMRPVLPDWQGELIDTDYANMLREVLAEGLAVVERGKLPKRSTLRALYEAHQVDTAFVFLIAQEPDKLVYGSVNIKDRTSVAIHTREAVRAGSTHLRELFSDSSRWRA